MHCSIYYIICTSAVQNRRQLEDCLKKEAMEAKLKGEKQLLIAELDLVEEEKAGLEVQLKEAEEKKQYL